LLGTDALGFGPVGDMPDFEAIPAGLDEDDVASDANGEEEEPEELVTDVESEE